MESKWSPIFENKNRLGIFETTYKRNCSLTKKGPQSKKKNTRNWHFFCGWVRFFVVYIHFLFPSSVTMPGEKCHHHLPSASWQVVAPFRIPQPSCKCWKSSVTQRKGGKVSNKQIQLFRVYTTHLYGDFNNHYEDTIKYHLIHLRYCNLELQGFQPIFNGWMFGEATILHVKNWNHPTETLKWMFQVPGMYLMECNGI